MDLFSTLKKLLITFFISAAAFHHTSAQAVNTYLFTTGTGGTIATLSSPNTLIASGVDDAVSSVLTFPSGFSFTYAGTSFTQYSVSSNGVLNFGSTPCPATYVNSIASIGSNIKLTPFWDDIITTGAGVRCQLLGSAPNRSFVIIWNGKDYTTGAAVQFQLTLFETSNVIRFDYGPGTGGTANIGIYNSGTVFESITVLNHTMSTTVANNSVAWPGAGRYYTFTPPAMPSISSFTPSSGCATVTPVTITGTNFTGITSVKFGTTNAQSFTVNSLTSITATPASGTTGTISVTNATGTASSVSSFTVKALPTVSYTASPSSSVCAGSSVTLNGTGANTYTWSNGVSNGAAFTPSSTGNYTVTGTSSTGCTATAIANIIVVQAPTTSNAGFDINVCGSNATLAANTPVIGTGSWSVISGTGGSFNNISSPTSTFTGNSGSSYTLRWTTTNGACTSADDVVVNLVTNPTTANAGTDQTICGSTTTLAANNAAVGTGVWSIISGTGGVITNPASPTSSFSGVAGSSYLLKWSINNSPCSSSADTVSVTFNADPSTANAGVDITTCSTSITLSANNPAIGTGVWSIVSGSGGSFGNVSLYNTIFNGLAGNTYLLRWTISNGNCTSTYDDVTVTISEQPTVANAGTDQNICGTTTILTGNNAIVGAGMWSIVSGNNGIIIDPANATSVFMGAAGEQYVLRWSIANSPCSASDDEISINFYDSTFANAGTDQSICENSSAQLQGTIGGSATAASWSTTGDGNFNPVINNLNAIYLPGNNDRITGNVILTLTTNNPSGVCVPASSSVNITINNLPAVNAGADREVCVSDTILLNGQLSGASVPVIWGSTGDGVFGDTNSLQTTYLPGSGDAIAGTVQLILRTNTSANVCGIAADTVVFIVRASVPPQPASVTGAPASVCPPVSGINLATANHSLASSYSWGISPGNNGISFVGTSLTNTQTIDLSTTTNSGYNLRVTAYNACGASPYRSVFIRRATSVPASVIGAIVACPGNSKTYSINDITGATTYKWTSTNGILLNGAASPKIVPDTNIVATFPLNFSTGTICVSSQVACFTSTTKCTTVSKSSPALNSLSGAANVCPNSTQRYSVPVTAGATNYTWTLPANITGSSTADTISVNIGSNFTAGSICVKATNTCGVVTANKCQQLIAGVPAKPTSISGPLAGVCGQTVTYTAPLVNGVSYAWTIASGAVINGPSNGNSISVSMPSPMSTAAIAVVAINGCGSSLSRSITVKGAPAQPGAITSNPGSFCANTQGVIFTVDSNTIMPGSTLLWTFPSSCTLVRGQGTASAMLNWGSANGTVGLKATNACGNATRTLSISLASLRTAGASTSPEPALEPTVKALQVNSEVDKAINLQAYPDAEQKILTFTFYAAAAGEYSYSLFDESNRQIRDGVIDAQEGVNMHEIEMSSLPSNVVYRLQVKNAEAETHINVTIK